MTTKNKQKCNGRRLSVNSMVWLPVSTVKVFKYTLFELVLHIIFVLFYLVDLFPWSMFNSTDYSSKDMRILNHGPATIIVQPI